MPRYKSQATNYLFTSGSVTYTMNIRLIKFKCGRDLTRTWNYSEAELFELCVSMATASKKHMKYNSRFKLLIIGYPRSLAAETVLGNNLVWVSIVCFGVDFVCHKHQFQK